MVETVDGCRRTPAYRCPLTGRSLRYAFRFPYIFPLLGPCRSVLLAPESPPAECLFVACELFLLRMVGLAIPCAHGRQHHHGFSHRAKDCACQWGTEPQKVVSLFALLELWDSWRLQIF